MKTKVKSRFVTHAMAEAFDKLLEEHAQNKATIKMLTERNQKIDKVISSLSSVNEKKASLPSKRGPKPGKAYRPKKDGMPDKILSVLTDGETRTTREVALLLGYTEVTEPVTKRVSAMLNYLHKMGRIHKPSSTQYRLKYALKPKPATENGSQNVVAQIGDDTRVQQVAGGN